MERSNILPLRREIVSAEAEAPSGGLNHWLDDVKLFAAAWLGALVFFGTYIA